MAKKPRLHHPSLLNQSITFTAKNARLIYELTGKRYNDHRAPEFIAAKPLTGTPRNKHPAYAANYKLKKTQHHAWFIYECLKCHWTVARRPSQGWPSHVCPLA